MQHCVSSLRVQHNDFIHTPKLFHVPIKAIIGRIQPNYFEKPPSPLYDLESVSEIPSDSPKNHLKIYATSTQATFTASGPHTHHDGQEQILEFVSEAQGVGAKQGEVPFHQLGDRTRQEEARGHT